MSIQSEHNTLHLGHRLNRPVTLCASEADPSNLQSVLTKGDLCPSTTLAEPATRAIVEALVIPPDAIWSTLMMYTKPFPPDLLQQTKPCHEVLFSCQPHRPGCHYWKSMQFQVHDEIQELQPDIIVERYLDAKYYQYSPEQFDDMSDYNLNATYLAESDEVITLQSMETDETSMSTSLRDNMQELMHSIPEWESDTQTINPKWLEHHQSGHLTKDPTCPVCMEEAGSKINHRRKNADRHPGIMHCDLAAFEASADGHKYCLVAAVTVEVDNVSKLLPFFHPNAQERCLVCDKCVEGSTSHVRQSQLAPNQGFQGYPHPGRWRWRIHKQASPRSMLGEEYRSIVLPSTPAIF